MINFTLPLPCSVNEMYTVIRGRKTLSPKARAWKKLAFYELKSIKFEKIDAPVSIQYQFTFPDNRTRDVSNYIKQVEDAIVNAGMIDDDKQVFALSAEKEIVKNERSVFVTVHKYVKKETENV